MLRKLKIGPRSILSFSMLGLITLLLGLVAIVQLGRIGQEVNVMASLRIPAATEVGEIRRDFLLIRLYTLNALYADDAQRRQDALVRLNELESSYQKNMAEMEKHIESDEGHQLLAKVVSSKTDYDQLQQRLLAMIRAGDLAGAEQFRHQGFNETGQLVTSHLNELGAYQKQRANDAAAITNKMIARSNTIMVVAIVLAMALVVVLALLFSRSLLLPIRKAVEVSGTIASGNLTSRFSDDARDEAGDMIRALATMQQRLKQTIMEINDSSSQLASTAEELSVVTDQSTRTLQQQSDELEQAATAVNEMTSAVEEVARNAAATSHNSDTADDKARIGRDKVTHTINTVAELEQEISHTRQGVESLATRVRDIGTVLDVIRGIAEQTNLLALNAAIEAARAGESGRGFAVVADEVRALAHRTQESTKEIEAMMHAIQSETNDTVSAIQVSTERSAQTRQIAQEAGEALALIADAIMQINEQNQTIASAAEEQASVSREVDRNLVNIRDLSVQTSAGANQTNASSNDLARLAEQLNQLVARFQV
ncbi:methyl-accepting chemotaxis sensory transducer [Oceanimonas sp. GK1]|uniref:methyl-accepting chemotaxis protein n=1 Tax=Oceanimonas sp. (strain GK1 / IBRC-M 10197) TaxID=511062 RepID=UPI0002494FE1|nr:methyl-accepting chemotaxis protein [Oceanimonas sp. GK1]AEY02667.1 methyl-accepting chemotaxis sensory transducer [Oceanimonas sp. GK1]